jgi:hypothetical protein
MIERHFQTQVILKTLTETEDVGNVTASYTNSFVMCYIEPLSGSRPWMSNRKTPFESWRMFCSSTEDIDYGDKINHQGVDFNIEFIAEHTKGANPHIVIELSRDL